MDKLLLGLLMLKRHTAYEIRTIISMNFSDMCSDSMGSIQAALKKLSAAQMVTFSEYVEKGVNKKRYSITDVGREALMEWLQVPADMSEAKNQEIGKLLFMGVLPAEKRLPIIDAIIENLQIELAGVLAYEDFLISGIPESIERAVQEWQVDSEYLQGIINATQNPDALKSADEIARFEMYALQYKSAGLQFNIDWFKALRKREENLT